MKTAFDFIKPAPDPVAPAVVQFSTIEHLFEDIERYAEHDCIKIVGLTQEAFIQLNYFCFFDVATINKYTSYIRWRGYSRWVAYENGEPVFATMDGSGTDWPPSKEKIVVGATKIYSDWRKVEF